MQKVYFDITEMYNCKNERLKKLVDILPNIIRFHELSYHNARTGNIVDLNDASKIVIMHFDEYYNNARIYQYLTIFGYTKEIIAIVDNKDEINKVKNAFMYLSKVYSADELEQIEELKEYIGTKQEQNTEIQNKDVKTEQKNESLDNELQEERQEEGREEIIESESNSEQDSDKRKKKSKK